MKKLLSLALAGNLVTVGATSVVACGAADGDLVGFHVNTTLASNDGYGTTFDGKSHPDGDTAKVNFSYNGLAQYGGLMTLSTLNLTKSNINSDYTEKQVAFNPNVVKTKADGGWQETLESNRDDFQKDKQNGKVWQEFYHDWSDADDSYFTDIAMNPQADGNQLYNPISLDTVPDLSKMKTDDYFQQKDSKDPGAFSLTSGKNNVYDSLVSFASVKDVLNYANTLNSNHTPDKGLLSWDYRTADNHQSVDVTQQARHILVPLNWDKDNGGIWYNVTFNDSHVNHKYTFNVNVKNMVARLDLATYTHDVKVNDKTTHTYTYQAWVWTGFDYWSEDSLQQLLTNPATSQYFSTGHTSNGNKYYVGYNDNKNDPLGDSTSKTDNGVFRNKAVINNGYSFNEFRAQIDPSSIKPFDKA